MTLIFRKVTLFWIVTVLVACSSPTPVLLPAEEIISLAVDRLQNLSGLHFVIDRSGAPAFISVELKAISLRLTALKRRSA
jgi:hypothetical protein